MNIYQSNNQRKLLEPEELEIWELMDFNDFIPNIEEPSFEDDFIRSNNLH